MVTGAYLIRYLEATWDNYCNSKYAADAKELGLDNYMASNGGINGALVTLTVNGVTMENVPVMVQPGQAVGTIRFSSWIRTRQTLESVETVVGVNAYQFYKNFSLTSNGAKIARRLKMQQAVTSLH